MDYFLLAEQYCNKNFYELAFETYNKGVEQGDIYCNFGLACCYLNAIGVKANNRKANEIIDYLIPKLEEMYLNDGKASYLLAMINLKKFNVSSIKKVKHYIEQAIVLNYEPALSYGVIDQEELEKFALKGDKDSLTYLMNAYLSKNEEIEIERIGNIALNYEIVSLGFKLLKYYRNAKKEFEYKETLNKLDKILNTYASPNYFFENNNGVLTLLSSKIFKYRDGFISIPSIINDIEVEKIDKLFAYSDDIYKIILPDTCKIIGDSFMAFSSLIDIRLSSSLESIGNNAFEGCFDLTRIDLPNSLNYIGEKAFANCSLYNLILPDNLKYVGNYAFSLNENLESVFIPNSVCYIGAYAFKGDKNLKLVRFDENINIDSIDEGLFYDCINLENINLPSSIVNIKSEAFANCKSLNTILIPSSVEYIEKDAFKNSGIEIVYAYDSNFEYIKTVFDYDNTIVVCKLKDESKSIEENIKDATSFDLDMNWENAFASDEEVSSTFVESVSEGLISSLSTLGRVDIEYISQISNIPLKEVIEKLGTSIYQDPLCWEECFYKGYKTSDDYLSGNLLMKLKIAEKYNKVYHGYFQKNVDALKKILPDAIKLDKIYFTIASNFIPMDLIKDFLVAVNGNKTNKFELSKNEITGKYEIEVTGFEFYVSDFARAYSTSRINAKTLIEHALNSSPVVIYDYYQDYSKKRNSVLNKSETIYAEQKVKQLNEDFISWVNEDETRKQIVENAYNEKYGYTISRNYDGSFLNFVGLDNSINLFDYQKNAIARIIFNRNTLLAHNVGTGKTYIMIASGEELIKMKKSKKNMYVVPNHILDQWKQSYEKLYPYSRIKVVSPRAFTPSNMFETLLDIKNGEYKAIIIASSCFDRIEVSKKRKIEKLEKELEIINKYLKKNNKNNSLRPQKTHLEKELEKLKDKASTFLGFDDLGITRLYVDEAHNYKNIEITTSLENIKGVSLSVSKKCINMMEKVEYMNSLASGGVIMATGTPITNSVTDVYTFQSYLQKGELELLSIKSFDNWVAMFSERHEEFEVDVDAVGYRVTSRLSRFHNLPELTSLLASVADFYQGKDDAVPDFNGYNDVVLEKTKVLDEYLQELSSRADVIRAKGISRKEDNLLMITNDGRKAALDIRLVKENYILDTDTCKSYECAKKCIFYLPIK